MIIDSLKPKFRARRLEPGKPLQVFRFDSPALQPGGRNAPEEDGGATAVASLNQEDFETRTLPPVATGVDKEEESEVHLREAITAAQLGTERVIIPTPSADAGGIAGYEELYGKIDASRHLPCPLVEKAGEYVKITTQMLEENGHPRYDATGKDENEFIERHGLTQTKYEQIIDGFVDGSIQKSQHEEVWNFWQKQKNATPQLKYQDAPTEKMGADPYVCFRRRQLRSALRKKTRRSNAQTAERLRLLHYDLEASRQMARLAVTREKLRLESARLEARLFEAYCALLEAGSTPDALGLPSYKSCCLNSSLAAGSITAVRLKTPAAPTTVVKKRVSQPKRKEQTVPKPVEPIPPAVVLVKPPPLPRFIRPHYPAEAHRCIARDIDALLAADASTSIPNLSLENLNLLPAMSLCAQFGGLSALAQEQRPERWATGIDDFVPRVTLDNRILLEERKTKGLELRPQQYLDPIQRQQRAPVQVFKQPFLEVATSRTLPPQSDQTPDSIPFPGYENYTARLSRHYGIPRLRVLPAKDCAQLNNAAVGNLNHHYLQLTQTAKIRKPQTLTDWINATGGLLVNPNSSYAMSLRKSPVKKKAPTSNNDGTASVSGTPSPKRKRMNTEKSAAPTKKRTKTESGTGPPISSAAGQ